MSLQENKLYHFYNQGNNRQRIFFSRENQLYFLEKFRKYVWAHCQVLTYCLMPNHFHFLINTTKDSVVEVKVGSLMIPALNNGFRQLLSSYAQAINKRQGRSGSLFRQKTKLLEELDEHYPLICFHYIHQNPLRSGFVSKLEDWEFSSFTDYLGMRNRNNYYNLLFSQLTQAEVRVFFYGYFYNGFELSQHEKKLIRNFFLRYSGRDLINQRGIKLFQD